MTSDERNKKQKVGAVPTAAQQVDIGYKIIVRNLLHSVYHVSEEITSITKCDLDLCVDSQNFFSNHLFGSTHSYLS